MAKKPKKAELIPVANELYKTIKPVHEEDGKPDMPPVDGNVKELLGWTTKAASLLEKGDTISNETNTFFETYEITHDAKVKTPPKAKPTDKDKAAKNKAAKDKAAKDKVAKAKAATAKAAKDKKAKEAKAKPKAPAEKKPAEKDEKDEFGFPIGSKRHLFVELVRVKGPITMTEVKKELGATFYDPWKVIVAKLGEKKAIKDKKFRMSLKA